MEIVYVYERARRDFGRHCAFEESDPKILIDVAPDPEKRKEYIVHDPISVGIQCVPEKSEHGSNTSSVSLRDQGMNHLEGAWPKNVDISDPQSKRIHIKSLLQEKSYKTAMQKLAEPTERYIKQNVALDLYEVYFDETEESEDQGPSFGSFQEKNDAKMIAAFKDPSKKKRAACHLSWLPGDGSKIAAAFCDMKFAKDFSDISSESNCASYIWDVSNPNKPESTLLPQSPLCCLEFNPKDTNLIVGGCYNGVVTLFDVRSPDKSPIEESDIKLSHRDPIYDIRWIQSKNSTMFLTVSTDGLVNLWDTRQFNAPIETLEMVLQEKNSVPPPYQGILGGFSLHYNAAHSASKYMVGTEQGGIIACTRRKNKPTLIDRTYVAHHGPVYSVVRNPFLPKYFLSIGDWTAKIWEEETESPIISTKYHDSYLTSGTWSTSRPGVFFATREDGCLDIWDLYHQQSHPALSLAVSQHALHTIRLLNGRDLAVGGVDGTVTIIQLSDSLSGFKNGERSINSEELEAMRSMFERESKREYRIINRRKELLHEKQSDVQTKERPAKVEIGGFDDDFENLIQTREEEEPRAALVELVQKFKPSEPKSFDATGTSEIVISDVDSSQIEQNEKQAEVEEVEEVEEFETIESAQAIDGSKIYRIQNVATGNYLQIAFEGDPRNLPSGSNSHLTLKPESEIWQQYFIFENGHITNVASGLRVHHGNQSLDKAFACMESETGEKHQIWSFEGEYITSELDGKVLGIQDSNSDIVYLEKKETEVSSPYQQWTLVEVTN